MKKDLTNPVIVEPMYIELALRELQSCREAYAGAKVREAAALENGSYISAEYLGAREARISFQNRLFGIKTALYFLGIIDSDEYCAD